MEENQNSNQNVREIFEKYYTKVALKNNSPIVSLDDIYEEALKIGEDEAEAVDVFTITDEYYFNWMIYASEDGNDLVAVPALTEKLKDMKLDKVVAWMYVNDVDEEIIKEFISDATLECLRVDKYIEEILALARKYFKVDEDWSNFNHNNYTGRIVYTIYDGNELLGKITEEVGYCNSCFCDGVFHDWAGCHENFIEKCTTWYLGEPKDEEH